MSCAGVNIGALSVKAVALNGKRREVRVSLHCGRPLETLKEILAEAGFAGVEYFGVSGQLGHMTEVAAIRRALREVEESFDAVASLGGEAFLVYFLTGGRITNVLSHNKCAAGSGEFFVQQIGRMGLGMEAAIQLSLQGKVVPLASRCSVHCKSDITHKLNRNEAAPEDILHTLHDSMANKVVALLEKGQRSRRRVLLIGGVSQNAAMLAALRAKLPGTEFVVRPESLWFEAWGTALLTQDKPLHRSPKLSVPPRLGRLPPLNRFADRVQRSSLRRHGNRLLTARWCWEWMPDRPPPRQFCWTLPLAAWWPRTTFAHRAIPWPRCARACAPLPTRLATAASG